MFPQDGRSPQRRLSLLPESLMTAVHPTWAVSLSHWRSTAVQIGHKHQSWQGWVAYGDTHSTAFWEIPALQTALWVLVQGHGRGNQLSACFLLQNPSLPEPGSGA